MAGMRLWRARLMRARLTGTGRLAQAALVCLLAAVLSGCLRLDADLRVGTDDTVTGDYVVAYLKDPQRPPTGLQPVRELLVTRGTATATRYDDGQYQGATYHLRGVPFADLAEFVAVTYDGRQTGTIEISRDGEEFVVGGTFDFRETKPVSRTPQEQKAATETFKVRVRLTFPGEVSESNGIIDGHTVTWQLTPFALTSLQARADASPPVPPPPPRGQRSLLPVYLLAAGAVLGVFIAVLSLAVLVRRLSRRRGESEAVGAQATDPTHFSWVISERLGPRGNAHATSPDRMAEEWPIGLGGPPSRHEEWQPQSPVQSEYGPDRPLWSYPAQSQPHSPGLPRPPGSVPDGAPGPRG